MSVEIRDFDSCGYERRTLFVDDVEVWADWSHEPEDVCLSRDLDRFVRALRKLSGERDAEREKAARLERERDALAAQLAALRGKSFAFFDAVANMRRIGPPALEGSNAEIDAYCDSMEALEGALADTAPAAEAYTRRVRLETFVDAATVARNASKALERERGEEAAYGAAYVSSEILSRAAEIRGGR